MTCMQTVSAIAQSDQCHCCMHEEIILNTDSVVVFCIYDSMSKFVKF